MAKKTVKEDKEEKSQSVDTDEKTNPPTEAVMDEAKEDNKSFDAEEQAAKPEAEIAAPTVFSKTREGKDPAHSGALEYSGTRKNDKGEDVENTLEDALDDFEKAGWNVRDVPFDQVEGKNRIESRNPKRAKNQAARSRKKDRLALAKAEVEKTSPEDGAAAELDKSDEEEDKA